MNQNEGELKFTDSVDILSIKKKWWKTQLFDKYEAILLIFQWWVERMQENNVEIDKEYTHTWASIHFNVKVMKAGVT